MQSTLPKKTESKKVLMAKVQLKRVQGYVHTHSWIGTKY
jgi:hypothetical protein